MSDDALDDQLAALAAQAGPKPTGDPLDDALSAHAKGADHDATNPPKEQSWLGKFNDVANNAVGSIVDPVLHTVSGMVAKPVSEIAGLAATAHDVITGNKDGDPEGFKNEVQDRLTYQPRSASGAAGIDILNSTVGAGIKFAGDRTGDLYGGAAHLAGAPQSVEDAIRRGTSEATKQGIGLAGLKAGTPEAPVDVPVAARAAADAVAAKQSSGAAGSAIDTTKLTPETQAELARVGQNANPTALANHAEAESLPVPVRLTEGQALNDAQIKSQEFNAKAQNNGAIGKRYDEQDQALQDNLNEFHRDAAPTAVGNDEVQNGQGVMDSLKRYDAPKKQAITDAYQAAKDANGGELPMDAKGFATQARQNLAESNRADFLPPQVEGMLKKVEGSGSLTLDQMESYRTILGEQARKATQAGDGTTAHAISSVRDALENTQALDGAAPAAKALYDNARGLAKSRFDEIKSDPAYEAAVNDSVPEGRLSPDADKFTTKYVRNAPKADLQALRGKLDDDGNAAMTSSGYNYLKEQAGLSKGKFLQNGYNTALDKVRPKAEELFGGKEPVENLEQLGRVANKTQAQSRGSYANNSHTLVGALASDAVSAGRGVLPTHLNTGIDIIGGALKRRAAARSVNDTLKPGAGLE